MPLTCAFVREALGVRIDVARHTINLVLSSLLRIGGPREVQSTREMKNGGHQVSLSDRHAAEPSTMPFVQGSTARGDDAWRSGPASWEAELTR